MPMTKDALGWLCEEHGRMADEEAAAFHLRTVHPDQWLPGTTVEAVELDEHGEPVALPANTLRAPNRAERRRQGQRSRRRWN